MSANLEDLDAVQSDESEPEHTPRDLWLKHWLCAEGAPMVELASSVIEAAKRHEKHALASAGASAGDTKLKRARKKTDQQRLDEAIELIVCNLALVSLKPNTTGQIAYWRQKGLNGSRYDNARVFAEIFLSAVGVLAGMGLLTTTLGSYREKSSTFAPTEAFRTELEAYGVTREHIAVRHTEETIILKTRIEGYAKDGTAVLRGSGKRVDYTDTPDTSRMREELARINEMIGSARLEFIDDGRQPEVDLSEKKLRRYFTLVESEEPRFDLGGRLFGGWWQVLKKDRRQHIRINGEPCCLIDYASVFPHLAYGHLGRQAPSDDLYDLKAQWPAFDIAKHRKATKVAFNSLFFGRKRLDGDLKAGLPKGATMTKLKDAIAAKHPEIAQLLGGRAGYELMMMESRIMLSVLTSLGSRGVVALPIHDAILVPISAQATAENVMVEEARHVANASVPVSTQVLAST